MDKFKGRGELVMTLSLYLVSLTVLLTFLVLSALQHLANRRKKLKEKLVADSHSPAIAGKQMR